MHVMKARVALAILVASLLAEAPIHAQSVNAAQPAPAPGAKAGSDHLSALDQFDRLQAAIRADRKQNDWRMYRVDAGQLKRFLNAAPASLLELARADDHAGDQRAALDELATYTHMGQASDAIDTLQDFDALRQSRSFKPIRDGLAKNRLPIADSSKAFTLAGPPWLPEDIDYDASSRRFFFSSVLQHKIVSSAADGATIDFARSPDGWPMMALKIDAGRHRLWATEVALAGFDAVKPSEQGRSALLCYDLQTGSLLSRLEGPHPSALGDLALTKDGDVIVSDGDRGGVYRLRSEGDRLERLDDGDFLSPQTVTIGSDGVHVFVPDYLRGIGVLDTRTKHVTWLSMKGRFALNGIDGLYRVGRRLIAVQNGTDGQRIAIFTLNTSDSGIDAERIIERATTTLGSTTHGVVVGDAFYYIAHSGWDRLNDNGTFKPDAATVESTVRRVSLRP